MKPSQEGILEHFQNHIYAFLRSKNEYREFMIARHQRSNLESFWDQLAMEVIRSGIFITPPLPRVLIENVPGPVYEQIDFSVQVVEYPITSPTGWSAISIAERVTSLLHLYEMDFDGRRWIVTCRTKDPWTFEGNYDRNVITVNFTTMGWT